MTPFLLDVNVLIALLDPAHTFHERASKWFRSIRHEGWATCPTTENGVLRILGGVAYVGCPGSPAVMAGMMRALMLNPGHIRFPDDLSLLASPIVDTAKLLHSKQVTDTYLLALAVSHDARLATFDKRLETSTVSGGAASLFVIP